ncbi:MAG: GspE/PulE family protein [Minisyncoccia bacterium]
MDDLTKKGEEKIKILWQESKERLAQQFAEKNNLLYANLKRTPIETSALELIDEKTAQEAQAMVFSKIGNQIKLAAVDPFSFKVIKIIENLKLKGYKVAIFVVTKESFDWAFSHYRFIKTPLEQIKQFLDVTNEKSIDFQNLHEALLNIKKEEVTLLVNTIFKSAVEADASDVHIEPQENSALIRFRVDGVLYEVAEIDKEKYIKIAFRLKLISGIKINLENIAQNGRFSIQNKDILFDVRASSLPSPNGEFFVFRILNPLRAAFGLSDLGLINKELEIFNSYLSSPNGMILITGPTGSGKTTTLYALLKKKYSPGIKIITIEDPIEYKLVGINQTQVTKNYDFATGLKSILRQDPDVILIGEIRDKDTAKTALQAALTGHLVFSTLHANEASGTIARLKELGAEPKLIADAVKLIVAQRLARRLCPYCKEKYIPSNEEKEKLLEAFSILSPKSGVKIPTDIPYLYKAKGCEKCHYLGYKGQIGFFEILPITSRIISKIEKEATQDEIRKTAIDEGMIPLFHEGLLKVIEGITSLDELKRVAGDIDYIKTLYKEIFAETLIRGIKIADEEEAQIEETLKANEPIIKLFKNLNKEKQIGFILASAFKSRATDVHFEPEEKVFKVRQRIDGVLNKMFEMDLKEYPSFVNEIKTIAGLKTEITQEVQEGRFKVILPKESFDIRLSIIPGGYGEIATLRLLGGEIKAPEIESLGLLEEDKKKIDKLLEKKIGLILASGPTSSGKTTTLFAILKKLAQPGVKIITVEDPIEYRLPNIVQTQVNEEKGYTFAKALRSLLRQNPNIFLIGEIRDKETAQLVWQSAMTGHLVLSTIHTNDALGVFPRLESLGIPSQELTTAINAIIAQRLVRKLCPYCKKEVKIPEKMKPMIKSALNYYPQYKNLIEKEKIYQAQGCPKCSFTGYYGLTGIFEIILVEKGQDIKKIDFPKLIDDATIKVLLGITSFEEIKRVLGL